LTVSDISGTLAVMTADPVEEIIQDWERERPDLDPTAIGLSARIVLLYRLLQAAERRGLRQVGLEPWAMEVLSALRRQGPPYQLTPTELRRAALLTSGAMTNRLDKLEAEGWVTRCQHPGDRRGLLVTLTESGRAKADEAVEVRAASVGRLTGDLAGATLDRASRVLHELILAFHT
jgi:DNA-binding MarR family transcriptional regulator